jgi:hypothetical protein
MPRRSQGEIKPDVRESTSDWDAFLPARAPAGAPIVLVALHADSGQAASSAYGGSINAPTAIAASR